MADLCEVVSFGQRLEELAGTSRICGTLYKSQAHEGFVFSTMGRVKGDNMISIRKLEKFTKEDQMSFGKTGFMSNYKYIVNKNESYDEIKVLIKRIKLDNVYKKEWPQLREDFDRYNEILEQGYSYGAFDDNKLVGVVIVEKREWNNSFWIEDIEVAEPYRKNGIGTMLLDKVEYIAKKNGVRIIALEAQSSNVPAIDFYRKNGYELDGIDLSLYTNTDTIDGEVAFFMKKKL